MRQHILSRELKYLNQSSSLSMSFSKFLCESLSIALSRTADGKIGRIATIASSIGNSIFSWAFSAKASMHISSITIKRMICFVMLVDYVVDGAKLGWRWRIFQIFRVKIARHPFIIQNRNNLVYRNLKSDEFRLDSSLQDDASQGPVIGVESVSDGGFSVMWRAGFTSFRRMPTPPCPAGHRHS